MTESSVGTAFGVHAIYEHPDFRGCYLATDGADWLVWPAERDGWARRHRVQLLDVTQLWPLPPFNSRLALRLSGAPRDLISGRGDVET
jgi:hypothetical protein